MYSDKLIVLIHVLLTVQWTWCGRINVPLDQSYCQHVSGGSGSGEMCTESGSRPTDAIAATVASHGTPNGQANVMRLPTLATDTLRGTSDDTDRDHKLHVRDMNGGKNADFYVKADWKFFRLPGKFECMFSACQKNHR